MRCRARPLVRFHFAAGADPGSRSKAFLPDDRRALDAPLASIITTGVEVASAKGCGRPSAPVRREPPVHRFDDIRVASAYPPIAAVSRTSRRVAFVPGTEVPGSFRRTRSGVIFRRCQWDMPKSRKLRTAPVPSAGKHCAIHSILGLRVLDRCACAHRNAFRRTTAQTVKSAAKGIDGDVSD